MTTPIGQMWDAMYAGSAYRYGRQPSRWLIACQGQIARDGRVLCIGDGEGRNGVWLAESGFRVTTIDASARGAEKARELAEARGVRIDARVGMFPDALEDTDFDAVFLGYVHTPSAARPKLHSAALERTRPGGLVIVEAFTPAQLGRSSGGPQDADMLFSGEMLRADFAAAEPLTVEEVEVDLASGEGHVGRACVVHALFRRPRSAAPGG